MGMGGMGGMGMGMPGQERERSTWLAEDQEVWGTDPGVGAGVLGRSAVDTDDEDDFGEFPEQRGGRSWRRQSRQGSY
jgi:hypothetical protein